MKKQTINAAQVSLFVEETVPIVSDSNSAQEVAKDLIYAYVKRGDDLKDIGYGGLGACSDRYHAMIGGHMKGKKYGNDKILVLEIDGKEVNEVFSLEKIYNEIKSTLKRQRSVPKIFVYDNLNIHQKINLHSNCSYAPHFVNQYSFGIGTGDGCRDISKWMTEEPARREHISYIPTLERNGLSTNSRSKSQTLETATPKTKRRIKRIATKIAKEMEALKTEEQ